MFTTTHLKGTYEDEFAGLAGQVGCGKILWLNARSARRRSLNFVVLACERLLKPLETRAKMIEKSKCTISALGFSEPVPVALGLWMTQLTA